MSDRIALIARIGAAMATADESTQSVLRDALAQLVEDSAVVVADERRKEKDRKRKISVESALSVESVESVEVSPSPLPSSSFPTPHITTSFPPTPSNRLSAPRKRTIRTTEQPSPDVLAVAGHYVATHPKRRPGPKDHKLIAASLLAGYSVADLCEAITGNATDQWHREKRKHALAYVLRDNGTIDEMRAKAETPEMWDYVNECLTPYGERVTRPDAA